MSEGQVRSLVERALVAQKSLGRSNWGDVVEAAFASGFISQDQWAEYVHGVIDHPRWSASALSEGLIEVRMDVGRLRGSRGIVPAFTLTGDVMDEHLNGQPARFSLSFLAPRIHGSDGGCFANATMPGDLARSGDTIEATCEMTATAANGTVVTWTVPVKFVVDEQSATGQSPVPNPPD